MVIPIVEIPIVEIIIVEIPISQHSNSLASIQNLVSPAGKHGRCPHLFRTPIDPIRAGLQSACARSSSDAPQLARVDDPQGHRTKP